MTHFCRRINTVACKLYTAPIMISEMIGRVPSTIRYTIYNLKVRTLAKTEGMKSDARSHDRLDNH